MDVEDNYIKYGKVDAARNKAFNDFDYFVKKCWMNTRKPLIAKYSIVDKAYDDEWKTLEDSLNMLNKYFQP